MDDRVRVYIGACGHLAILDYGQWEVFPLYLSNCVACSGGNYHGERVSTQVHDKQRRDWDHASKP